MRTCLFILLSLLFAITGQAQPSYWHGLEYGPHPIGLKTLLEYDLSRPPLREQMQQAQAEQQKLGRALQANFWYPAAPTSKHQPITLNHYLLLGGKAIDFYRRGEAQEAAARDFYFRYEPAAAPYFDSLLSLQLAMGARINPPPAEGAFPVVFIVHQDPANIAVLAEYLASYGYVVVNFPLLGSFDQYFDFQETSGLESEVRDLEFAMFLAKTIPFADASTAGIVGPSFGSLSAVAYHLRSGGVQAIVSLDGGIAESWGARQLSKMPYYSLEGIDMPLLHMYSPVDAWNHAPEYFLSYKYCDKYRISLPEMRHQDFTNYGLFSQFFPEWIDAAIGPPKGRYQLGFKMVARYTRHFFDGTLKGMERPFLERAGDDSAAEGLLEAAFIPALPKPMSLEAMINLATEQGFEPLLQAYHERKRFDPLPVPLVTFFSFSNWLLRENKLPEALEWTLWLTEDYPEAARAHYARGRALQLSSRKVEALEAYQQAMRLLPADDSLDRHLRMLLRRTITSRIKEVAP